MRHIEQGTRNICSEGINILYVTPNVTCSLKNAYDKQDKRADSLLILTY